MPRGSGTCLGGTEQPHHVPSFASLLGSQEDGRASGTHRVVQPTPCHLRPLLTHCCSTALGPGAGLGPGPLSPPSPKSRGLSPGTAQRRWPGWGRARGGVCCAGPAKRREMRQIPTHFQRVAQEAARLPEMMLGTRQDRTRVSAARCHPTSNPCPQHTQPCEVDTIPAGCPPCACPKQHRDAAGPTRAPAHPPGQQAGIKAHPDPTMLFHGTGSCDTPMPPLAATHGGWITQAAMGECPSRIKPLIGQAGALQPPSRLEPASPGERHRKKSGWTQLSGPTGAGHKPRNYR